MDKIIVYFFDTYSLSDTNKANLTKIYSKTINYDQFDFFRCLVVLFDGRKLFFLNESKSLTHFFIVD